MKETMKKCGAWLLAAVLAFAGTGAAQAETVAKIGETPYETLAAAIAAAKAGDTVEIVKADTYSFPSLPKNITLSCCDGVIFNCEGSGSISSVPNGCTVIGGTFNMGQNNYHGWQHADAMAFNGSTFSGKFFGYANLTFTGCHFVQTAEDYCMWTYSSPRIDYINCTFDCVGKAVNVYWEQHECPTEVTADGCTFNSSKENKPALKINSKYGAFVVATTANNTLSGFPRGISGYDDEPNEGDYAYIVTNAEFDEAGKLIGGDANREFPESIVGQYFAADLATVSNTEGETWKIGVKTEDETIITTKPQESKVEVPQDVIEDTEVAQKIEQSTKVEGVKLSAAADEGKTSGIVAVVEEAKKNTEFAAAVDAAAEVSVKVEVEVKPTEYDNTSDKGKVAFKLTPKATVTVVQNETELKQVVPVTNDMIDQNQKIAVSIYTGFPPVAITHDDDNGSRIELFEGDQIVYDQSTGVATVLISHFSTLTSYGDANDVPEPKVYVAYIGTTGYETIQAAVDAANVSAGSVTIKVMAGTHNETVDLKKSNLTFEEGGKTWYGRINLVGEEGAVISGQITFGKGPVINVADVTFDGLTFVGTSNGIYIDNSTGNTKNITIKNNTFNFNGDGPYVISAVVDGLTVTGNHFNCKAGNKATLGGAECAINNVTISGNTFEDWFGIYGQVLEDGVIVSGNTFTGTHNGYCIWINDNKAVNVGKITISDNDFANTITYPVGFANTYGKKSDITIGADNAYGDAAITGWAEVADHEVLISGDAEEALAQYYNHKLYLGDETAFATLDAAVAASKDDEPITIVNYDSSTMTTAPEGWAFKTEGGVTKLVKKATYVAEIFVNGESKGKYEKVGEALRAAANFPGTAENPTIVQLASGIVSDNSFAVSDFSLTYVTVQGSGDHATEIKNTAIQSDGGNSVLWKGVTFKNIVFDNSHFRFSTFGVEDLTVDNNVFRNLAYGGTEGGVHFNLGHNGNCCKNLTYVNNVFDTSSGSSIAAINTTAGSLSGDITITNNVFKNSAWRSLQLMVNANDGVADNFLITDNWFNGNASAMQITKSGDHSDAVSVTFNYNAVDDGANISQIIIYDFDLERLALDVGYNYYLVSPDENPGKFYLGGTTTCTKENIGPVYPYYANYDKDALEAGTKTVREALYNLVELVEPVEEIEIPVDDSGEAVIPVKVAEEVFEQKSGQEIKDKDGNPLPAPTTTEEKQQFLVAEQPNGLKVWQNVAMGVDGNTAENALATISREPTAEEKAEAEKDGKTVDIVINTPISEFDPPTTTGVTVSYKLLRSTNGGVTWTEVATNLEKPEFPTYTKDDALISEGDTFWKFQAVFTSQANAQTE